MPWEDDDDWTGTPPEGRHTRDQAKPDFWRTQGALIQGAGVLLLIVLIVALVLLT